MFDRFAVPLALLVAVASALVWPALRQLRRTGTTGVVLRSAAPLQRIVGASLALMIVSLGVFAVGVLALGPAAMGVREGTPAAGWPLFALGLAVVVVAQAQMGGSWRIGIDDQPTALVTGGLFRWSRNPIYSGLVSMLAGLTVAAPAVWTAATTVGAAVVIALQARLEERHLLALHGDAFRAYASRVGRFLPGLGRLEPR